jgi:hypothetical protein
MDSGVLDDLCAPFSTAASMVCHVHGLPQSTGTPVSHFRKVSTKGWKSTHAEGGISCLPRACTMGAKLGVLAMPCRGGRVVVAVGASESGGKF